MLSTCTAGIEKALKLVQSFSQVAEVIVASTPKEVAQWATAKDQANIGKSTLPLPAIPLIVVLVNPFGLLHCLFSPRALRCPTRYRHGNGSVKSLANLKSTARRYFRLFKWIDCWTTSYNLFQAYTGPKQIARDDRGRTIEQTRRDADGDSVRVLLTITKLSLLGIFLFMEMFCIVSTTTLLQIATISASLGCLCYARATWIVFKLTLTGTANDG